MKTIIYIVRHGQSLTNPLRIIAGHTDVPLSALGEKQAALTASVLSEINFSAIYSSDLSRAYNTALAVAEGRGLDVITDVRLRELYCGEWENRKIEEIIEEYGELYTVEWRERFGVFTPPGGESVPDAASRFYQAICDIGERHLGKTVLSASHGGIIRAFFGMAYNIDPVVLSQRMNIPSNASYSVVEYEDGNITPILYSADAHLAELATEWKD